MNRLELEELVDQAENLISLSDILTDSLVNGGSASIRYAGAAQILEHGIRELHTQLKELFHAGEAAQT